MCVSNDSVLMSVCVSSDPALMSVCVCPVTLC